MSFLQTAPLLINVLLALMLKAEKRAAGSAMEEIAHTWTQDNMATGRQTLSHYGSEMGKPVNQALMLLLSQMIS